jgi:hypothetical protein
MFGVDVVGAGVARASLQASRGLRVGRRSIFDGPCACALIIPSNFLISVAISPYISAFSIAASACVKPSILSPYGAVWDVMAGRVFSSFISACRSLFCYSNAVILSVWAFIYFYTSCSIKWFSAHVWSMFFIPSITLS